MFGASTTLDEDRMVLAASRGLDASTMRRVRQSVRRGEPVDDETVVPLAVVYLEIYERSHRENQGWRISRWIYLVVGILWIVIGVLSLRKHVATWPIEFLVAAVSFVGVFSLPYFEARRVQRLAQSRANLQQR